MSIALQNEINALRDRIVKLESDAAVSAHVMQTLNQALQDMSVRLDKQERKSK